MRKFSLILSLLVMSAMVLAACGGEQTSTSVPSTNVPPVTVDSTSTGEASGTETTATVDPNATADTTTTPGVPVTGEQSPSRLSVLLGFDVWNQEGEQIGEVEDMILDMDNTNISYVIVGTGGFLEIGEREVLVPWNSLQLQSSSDAATSTLENAFILQTDQETFNTAPDVDVDAVLPGMGTPASDWDNDIRNYWESGVLPSTPAADATAAATASPEMTATVDAGAGQARDLQGVMLASDLIGSTITIGALGQAQGEGVATMAPDTTPQADATATPATDTGSTGAGDTQAVIDDVILDPESGAVQYLVLDVAFDDGERWIPVPLGFLQWNATDESFAVRVDSAALQSAPFFEGGEYPDMTADGWDGDYNSYWQNQ